MDLNTLINHYKTLLPWNLARIKCFSQIIFGMIIASNVQQHKCALGFTNAAKQDSTCRRIRNFLSKFSFDPADIARALVAICQLTGPLHLAIDRTNWKFGCVDINLLVLAVVVSRNFSIPLFWKALPKKGNSNTRERIDILQLFVDVFGAQRIESLFSVVASALALVFLVGRKEEALCPTPYKKSIKAPAFSTFRRGFDFLRKLLVQSKSKAFCLLAQLLMPLTNNNSAHDQKIVR